MCTKVWEPPPYKRLLLIKVFIPREWYLVIFRLEKKKIEEMTKILLGYLFRKGIFWHDISNMWLIQRTLKTRLIFLSGFGCGLAEGQGFGQDNVMRCHPVLRFPASRIVYALWKKYKWESRALLLWDFGLSSHKEVYTCSAPTPALPTSTLHPQPPPWKVSRCQTIYS